MGNYISQAMEAVPSILAIGKAAMEMAKASDQVKRNEQLLEFQAELIKLNQRLIELQFENGNLDSLLEGEREKVRQLEQWRENEGEYTCRQVGTGVFAYVKDGEIEAPESMRKYCCSCFQKRKLSILQRTYEKERVVGLACAEGCPKLVFTHYIDS